MSRPKYVMTICPFEDEGKLYESDATLRVAVSEAANNGDLENVRVYAVAHQIEVGKKKE